MLSLRLQTIIGQTDLTMNVVIWYRVTGGGAAQVRLVAVVREQPGSSLNTA